MSASCLNKPPLLVRKSHNGNLTPAILSINNKKKERNQFDNEISEKKYFSPHCGTEARLKNKVRSNNIQHVGK